MKPDTAIAGNVDEYIARFPESTQKLLRQLRSAIRRSAPKAAEVISYGMPAYKYHGMLAYFAGYAKHIGFYPTASGIANFKKDISGYKNAKGSVQFPLDEPLPLKLVVKMIVFRAGENLARAQAKARVAGKAKIKTEPKTRGNKSSKR